MLVVGRRLWKNARGRAWLLLLCWTVAANAWGGRFYSNALVVSMNVTACYKPGGGVMAALMGGEARAPYFYCAEYLLESDRVRYRIHAREHSALLPVGETVKLRMSKNRLLVRVDDSEEESDFDVISMELREEPRPAKK